MDELVQLRSLVAGEPTEDEEARAEVWRRLSTGRPDRRGAPRRRLGVVTGFAVCVAVVTAMFTVRSGPIGVEPAEAACGGSGAPSRSVFAPSPASTRLNFRGQGRRRNLAESCLRAT